jgi:hypothetical protein
MNNPDPISESLETIFWVKILKFFDVDPASGMEKIWIRDPGEPLIIIFNLSFITGDELLRAPLQAALLPGASGHASQPVQVQVSLRLYFSTQRQCWDLGHFGADPDPQILTSD